jgi:translation initiation factor IF-1
VAAVCFMRGIAGLGCVAAVGSRSNRSGRTQVKEFDAITMSGTVIGTNRGSATVQLENGSVVRGTIAGRLMKNRIRVVAGDKVKVEMNPYDLTKGRVIWRDK